MKVIDYYHVRELQTAAKPITTVPITKRTLLKLDSNVGGVWFFVPSLAKFVGTANNKRNILVLVHTVFMIH